MEEELDESMRTLRISSFEEPPRFYPHPFREECYQKTGDNYNMTISALTSDTFIEYVQGRMWNERASSYLQQGCREDIQDTWTDIYRVFLKEISSIFSVCCVRGDVTRALFEAFPHVPFLHAILDSLSRIIISDNYSIIEYYQMRYDRALLLPQEGWTKQMLKDYYRAFLQHPPRRVVGYLIEERKGEKNINYDDLYLRCIHKAAILLAKRIIMKTTPASSMTLYPTKHIFSVEDDTEDRYKIVFFDRYVQKHPVTSNIGWYVLLSNVPKNSPLFGHILDIYNVSLPKKNLIAWELFQRRVDPKIIRRVLDLKGVYINEYAIEELADMDQEYRYNVFKGMNDRIRQVIGTIPVMQGFENLLLEEAIEITELLASKGFKGWVRIDALKSNSVTIRHIINNGKYRDKGGLLNLLAKYRIFYPVEPSRREKYVTYFDISDFTKEKSKRSREMALLGKSVDGMEDDTPDTDSPKRHDSRGSSSSVPHHGSPHHDSSTRKSNRDKKRR